MLFTRPRRFDKTTMLKMTRAFYADIEKIGLAYFKDNVEICMGGR